MNILTPGLKPRFRLRLLFQKRLAFENLYPDTAAQLSPVLTGFLISTCAFRGRMRQQFASACSRMLNSQRTGVISECW
jgi:hypothetical protein